MTKNREKDSIINKEILYQCKIDRENENNSHTKIIKLAGKDNDILEIGCSTGYMTKVLYEELGSRITCIEVSENAADLAKPFCVDMIIGDIETLDLKQNLADKRFDVIIMADVLEHLRHPNVLLENLISFLKEDGFILLSIPNGAHGAVALKLLDGKWDYRDLGLLDRSHIRFFDKDSLIAMLDEAGYVVSRLERVIVHPEDTEFKTKWDSYPSEVTTYIQKVNLEFQTYQFVVKAYPKHLENHKEQFSDTLEYKTKNTNSGQSRQIKTEDTAFDQEIVQFWQITKELGSQIVSLSHQLKHTRYQVTALEQEKTQFQQIINDQDSRISLFTDKLQDRDSQISLLTNKVQQADELQQRFSELSETLARIHKSKSWKLIKRYYTLRDKILPRGTRRRKAVRLIWRSIWYLYRYGMRMFLKKAYGKIRGYQSSTSVDDYLRWILEHEPTTKQLTSQKVTTFSYIPKISLIVPLWNTPEKFLHEMIKSVRKQTYANWELCLADGGSSEASVGIVAREYAANDPRIRFTRLDVNKGIVGNSNAALSLATGDYVAFLDHDDLLPPFSLFEVAKAINEHLEVDFIYSDEDHISENSKYRFEPHFKPEFCPDTLRSYNYICHLIVVKKSLLDELGGFREGFDGSQDYDLILRITEKAKTIIHIPKVLYHWRVHPSSLSYDINGKLIAVEAAKKALNEHLHRLGVSGVVEPGLFLTSYKIRYAIVGNPLVSIIVPTINNYDILKTCINSILSKTTYKNYEILIVDTGSNNQNVLEYYKELTTNHSFIHLVQDNRPFNYSAVNNLAVTQTKGDILLFLNNDVEVINADWIERMLEQAQRKPIGAVGAKLYYPDGRIQHGGIIIGLYGVAGHLHKCFPQKAHGYVGRLQVTQNLSAVTGACLMMRRNVFEEVGGFDDSFALAFNDVDLCLKIIKKNYRIVWTPYAELYHHESKTRGYEDTQEKYERFVKEINLFKIRWKEILEKGDPCYSPNLTLNREDFSIKTSS